MLPGQCWACLRKAPPSAQACGDGQRCSNNERSVKPRCSVKSLVAPAGCSHCCQIDCGEAARRFDNVLDPTYGTAGTAWKLVFARASDPTTALRTAPEVKPAIAQKTTATERTHAHITQDPSQPQVLFGLIPSVSPPRGFVSVGPRRIEDPLVQEEDLVGLKGAFPLVQALEEQLASRKK